MDDYVLFALNKFEGIELISEISRKQISVTKSSKHVEGYNTNFPQKDIQF